MTDYVFAGRVGRLDSRETTTGNRLVTRVGGEGDLLIDYGYRERAYQGDVHTFSVAAVTVPVNANNLVSVFGIYNPPGSGKILEMIDTDVVNVLATTVVGGYAWYSSTVALSALATFTTAGSARNGRLEDGSSTVARVYTAVTHSGTPSLAGVIGADGAATNTQGLLHKAWNGRLLIPPGVLASVAQTTNASTASGKTVMTAWADIAL
jgi:hypothetical protein